MPETSKDPGASREAIQSLLRELDSIAGTLEELEASPKLTLIQGAMGGITGAVATIRKYPGAAAITLVVFLALGVLPIPEGSLPDWNPHSPIEERPIARGSSGLDYPDPPPPEGLIGTPQSGEGEDIVASIPTTPQVGDIESGQDPEGTVNGSSPMTPEPLPMTPQEPLAPPSEPPPSSEPTPKEPPEKVEPETPEAPEEPCLLDLETPIATVVICESLLPAETP